MNPRPRFAARALALALLTGAAVAAPVVTSTAASARVEGVDLVVPSTELVRGEALTLVATVPKVGSAKPAGSITFTLEPASGTPTEVSVALVNGVAKYNTRGALAVGSHVLRATYAGGGAYSSSVDEVSVTVAKGQTTTAVTAPASVATGAAAAITAKTVAVVPGKPVLTGKTTYTATDGTTTLTKVVSASSTGGAAKWSPKLADGTWTVTAAYAGNANADPSTSAPATIVVGAAASTVDQSYTEPQQFIWFASGSNTGFELTLTQTFTAGRTGSLDQVSLAPTTSYTDTTALRVDIVTLDGNGNPTTDAIGTTTWAFAPTGDFVDIPLATPAPVVAGERYAIAVTPDAGMMYLGRAETNDYLGGTSGERYYGRYQNDLDGDVLFKTWVR